MDNQISRQMLEHFEISNDQEIGKITTISAMRGIENGSLHFIPVARDQEFIDHSLLNPGYLAQLPNGLIVDFIPNGYGEQTQHIIADAVTADLTFQGSTGNDEQDRRLTAALLQLVNKPCHMKIGNETQVIVSNKELTLANDEKTESIQTHTFSTVSSEHVLQTDSIDDSHYKIYQHQKLQNLQTEIQVNPPLPPLTPIRRLVRQRKNSVLNAPTDVQIFQVNEISGDEEIENRQRPLTKKSLPHKKRISKKLKTIDRIEATAPPPVRQTVIYQDIQNNQIQEVETQLIQPQQQTQLHQQPEQQFACQLCSRIYTSQLDFFAHLKGHYEPEALTSILSTEVPTNEEIIVQHQDDTRENLGFSNFTATSIEGIKMEPQNDDLKQHGGQDTSQETDAHRVDLHMDEVEFSDTEDMLEGIRGVVDKVQESVENDSIDGNDWYSSNSMNGNIAYKSDDNNPHVEATVDNFSMFFKDNLKDNENQQIVPSVGEAGVQQSETSDVRAIATHESYEAIKAPLEIVSEIATMLIENQVDDSSTQKSTTKRIQRVHKPKQKPKPSDDDDDCSDFGGLSSDDDEKYKKQPRKCTLCDKVFNSSNAFKYHELSHTGERPYQCDICGKSFFAQSALKVHMRLHSGAKPYECEICKRAFRQWGDLKYHTVSIHTNERNFQCEFCGKAFARRYSLVIHRRIHTSERNYKCEFCPKSFRASSYLQNHRKVHTGEKPYACPTCGKKFRVSGDLKRHTKIHGREKKKKGGVDETTEASLKTDTSNKTISKPINEQIIQFMPKSSTSPGSVDIQSIKTEPNILMDLNLLQDDLNHANTTTTHQILMKLGQNVQETNSTGHGTIIYSDGAVEIFKTETVDRF